MSKLLIILFFTAAFATAENVFPKPDWKPERDPIASEDAYPGGTINIFASQSPKSFNYYLETSYTAAQVWGLMYETLLDSNSVTLADEPGLARKWVIADDKKTFTFHMDPDAKWSDGKPVTAQDVKWTFDIVMDPKSLTGPHKTDLERFESPEIIDDSTIRFSAKEVHWKNLNAAGGFYILPKHVMAEKDFNKLNFDFPIISGPYRIKELKDGIYVMMERREDWWMRGSVRTEGLYNFDEIKFRFYAERDNAYEAFKKGDIDVFPVYTAHRWVTQTKGEKFDRNWIVKQKIYNHNPVGYQGFAMNMRRPPLDDVRVRKAIAHLIDRPKMNETLMHKQYFLHKSYYEDLWGQAHPCPNVTVAFEKAAARKLLTDAGWIANPETGILEKDGKQFHLRVLTRSASADKFIAIIKEDFKDVGIELSVDKKDWAAWIKDMDAFNFDLTWAAWGAGPRKDPESMWYSKEADRESGNNYTGFKNDAVDTLIEKQRSIFDINERHEIVRQVDNIIFNEHPYALLWNINYTRLLYWQKFGMPDTILSKYGEETSVIGYWWYDEDTADDLTAAREETVTMPQMPTTINFDDIFEND